MVIKGGSQLRSAGPLGVMISKQRNWVRGTKKIGCEIAIGQCQHHDVYLTGYITRALKGVSSLTNATLT